MRAALVMQRSAVELVITPAVRDRLLAVGIDPDRQVTEKELLSGACSDVELLMTGWQAPPVTAEMLDRMPALEAIVHWGGAVDFVSPDAWARGIRISSAGLANAVPVAEFTLAAITLAAKDVIWVSRKYSSQQRGIDREVELTHVGMYGTSVGIVGASRIGSLVLEGLRSTAVDALLYDPTCPPERAAGLGATAVDNLVDLAARSRILSLHAPVLPSTVGMISRQVLAAMPEGATLINTARGALVDQVALLEEVESGRLRAIVDVTDPEVLPAGHPFYTLPNVFLTPHLAGSAGNELERLGLAATAEVERFASGSPFAHPVPTPEYP